MSRMRAYTSTREILVGKGLGPVQRTRSLDAWSIDRRATLRIRSYRCSCTSTRGVARHGLPGERASRAARAHPTPTPSPRRAVAVQRRRDPDPHRRRRDTGAITGGAVRSPAPGTRRRRRPRRRPRSRRSTETGKSRCSRSTGRRTRTSRCKQDGSTMSGTWQNPGQEMADHRNLRRPACFTSSSTTRRADTRT